MTGRLWPLYSASRSVSSVTMYILTVPLTQRSQLVTQLYSLSTEQLPTLGTVKPVHHNKLSEREQCESLPNRVNLQSTSLHTIHVTCCDNLLRTVKLPRSQTSQHRPVWENYFQFSWLLLQLLPYVSVLGYVCDGRSLSVPVCCLLWTREYNHLKILKSDLGLWICFLVT